MRYVPRDLHEDARDVARALVKTEAYEQSRRERKKVEMRFAHMKRIFKLDRLRLRGLSGAKDEVATDRNRSEPAAPRQVPLPPAALGGSSQCRVAPPIPPSDGTLENTLQSQPRSNPVEPTVAAGFCNTFTPLTTEPATRQTVEKCQ